MADNILNYIMDNGVKAVASKRKTANKKKKINCFS